MIRGWGQDCRDRHHVHFRDPATEKWRCAAYEDEQLAKQEERDRRNGAEKMRRMRERRRTEAMA